MYIQELLLAEKWASLNNVKFPPVKTSEQVADFKRKMQEDGGVKELYIFQHPTDPLCPVVFHFVLINKKFRDFKKPGKYTLGNITKISEIQLLMWRSRNVFTPCFLKRHIDHTRTIL